MRISLQTLVRILVIGVTVGGILFLFVIPGRTWLSQSQAISQSQHQRALLTRENQQLTKEASLLQSSAYVERIARQQYGLVMPGEQAYGILPPAVTTTTSVP